jgi:hypothetical protein
MSAGKGDRPRPVNGKVYRKNFGSIDWRKKLSAAEIDSHLAFMRRHGFPCSSEQEAYELRGLLDM